MEITDIRLRRLNSDGNSKMKAVFSVTFDNEFVVHDIRVIENNGRLFCAMPSRRKSTAQTVKSENLTDDSSGEKSSTFTDIVHPIGAAFREKLENRVLDEYYKATLQGLEK